MIISMYYHNLCTCIPAYLASKQEKRMGVISHKVSITSPSNFMDFKVIASGY